MLSDEVNIVLQSLKEAKLIKRERLRTNQEQQALRRLINPKKYDERSYVYGGLLISSFNKKFNAARISENDQQDVINSTFMEIYKNIDNMEVDADGKICKGLRYINKVFTNQIKQLQRREITSRGDWHNIKEETRQKVKDFAMQGWSYRRIGFELKIPFDLLTEKYKSELDTGKEENPDMEAKRIHFYKLDSRRISSIDNSINEKDFDDYESDDFIGGESDNFMGGETDDVEDRAEPIDFISNSKNKNIRPENKNLVDCVRKGFKSFQIKEPDRALVITLKFPDFYDRQPRFLEKAWKKFKAPKEVIDKAAKIKLSSMEIGEIIDKKASNVDVYYAESKKKFKPSIKDCLKLNKGMGWSNG